jgi:exopolysaccharide production protein ExoQ
MTPGIALTACIAFIIVLFIQDLKGKPNVSYAHLIPLAWFLYCAFGGVGRWFVTDRSVAVEIDVAEGNPIDRPILSVLIAVGLYVLVTRRASLLEILRANKWIVMLFLYMAISILWSDFPLVSWKRWVRSFGDFIMVLTVLSEEDSVEGIKRVIRRCAYITLPLSIVFIKYFRDIGVKYTLDGQFTMWVGVTSHKNELGALALICGILVSWDIITGGYRNGKTMCVNMTLLLMALWLLNGSASSDSKTSWMGFILGICVLVLLNLFKARVRNLGRDIVISALALALISGAVEAFGGMSLYEVIVTASGRDTTLTGRTDLWKDIFARASESPILGVGFGSFWIGNVHHVWENYLWRPTQAHNGYLDIYLELGLVGIFLLLLMIISSYKSISNSLRTNFRYGSLRLVFFLIVIVHNISESSFLRGTSLLWFVLLLSMANPAAETES